jgi:putative salt-induced outer membrane protein YdiY
MNISKQSAALLLGSVVLLNMRVLADDASAKPWKNTGEVSVVSSNGNSKATSTSAKDTFNYKWSKAALELIAGGLGSSSGNKVTAEQYNASEKVLYPFTDSQKNYVFEKFGWDKNQFAGYRNRWDGNVGYGREIFNISSNTLTSEIGGGYINEERIDAPRNDFASGRAYAKYVRILSATAQFSQDAEYLHDWSDSKDYRLNTETAIIASLTTHLSLKASYKWNRVGKPPAGIGKDDTTTMVALIINY